MKRIPPILIEPTETLGLHRVTYDPIDPVDAKENSIEIYTLKELKETEDELIELLYYIRSYLKNYEVFEGANLSPYAE